VWQGPLLTGSGGPVLGAGLGGAGLWRDPLLTLLRYLPLLATLLAAWLGRGPLLWSRLLWSRLLWSRLARSGPLRWHGLLKAWLRRGRVTRRGILPRRWLARVARLAGLARVGRRGLAWLRGVSLRRSGWCAVPLRLAAWRGGSWRRYPWRAIPLGLATGRRESRRVGALGRGNGGRIVGTDQRPVPGAWLGRSWRPRP
jgi:hypothetical protein